MDSILVFPEDLGGHKHHGPASVWQLREFQVLECDHDARRGAGFLCQLAHAEQKRPLGILTTLAALHSDLCMGWPKFVLDQNDLRYVGPLPRDCGCLAQHSPMVGCNTDQHFFSSMSPTLGPLFWKRIWKAKAEEKFPLRDGKSAVHFSPSSQCPSLASGVDSRQRLFKLWQSRGLIRESLSQWAEAKEVSATWLPSESYCLQLRCLCLLLFPAGRGHWILGASLSRMLLLVHLLRLCCPQRLRVFYRATLVLALLCVHVQGQPEL